MRRVKMIVLMKRIIAIVTLLGLIASGVSIMVLISGCRVDDLTINFYFKETQEMMWPTVRIGTGIGIGTGVVIDGSIVDKFTSEPVNSGTNELFVLTAAHVVGDESTVTIELFTHPEPLLLEGTIIITDTAKDLALIRINGDCFAGARNDIRVWSAQLAPKDYVLSLFTPVWAVGCSLGMQPRPSYGIISSVSSAPTGGCALVEITAPIVPGNSGGPVYALNGQGYEVIGIAVSVYVYKNQLVTTMARIIPIGEIYNFLQSVNNASRSQD